MGALSTGPRLVSLAVLLALTIVLLAAACSGDGRDGGDGGSPAAGGPASFDISLGDDMRDGNLVSFFLPNELTVAAGQQVTLNLSNDGTVPHNMRIAGPDGDYNTDDDTIMEPNILKPGDKAVIEWTAPGQPGATSFRCDFHPDSVGAITVE